MDTDYMRSGKQPNRYTKRVPAPRVQPSDRGKIACRNGRRTGSRLEYIEKWAQLAQDARYSLSLLARNLGVSKRTIQRFTKAISRELACRFLKRLRMERALALFRAGKTLKEAADLLCYTRPDQLSEDFAEIYGDRPTRYAGGVVQSAAQMRDGAQDGKLSLLPGNCRAGRDHLNCSASPGVV